MNAAESAAPGGEPAGHRGSVLWPFSASVVRQDWADRVVSPAYEGLGVEERRSLMLAQPDSYMHATRSPEDVGYALSPAELAVLNQMALIRLLRLGAFESRPAPAVYVSVCSHGPDRKYPTAINISGLLGSNSSPASCSITNRL